MVTKKRNLWVDATTLSVLACVLTLCSPKFAVCRGRHASALLDSSLSQGRILRTGASIDVALAIPYQDARRLAASLARRNDNEKRTSSIRMGKGRRRGGVEKVESTGSITGDEDGGAEDVLATRASSASSTSSSDFNVFRLQGRNGGSSAVDSLGKQYAFSSNSSDCAFADGNVAYTLVVYFPLKARPSTGGSNGDREDAKNDSMSAAVAQENFPDDRENAAREVAASLMEQLQRRHPECFVGHQVFALDLGDETAQSANVLSTCRACSSFYSLFDSLHGLFDCMLLIDRSSKPLYSQWLRVVTKEIYNGFSGAGSEFWVRGASHCARPPNGASSSEAVVRTAFGPQLEENTAVLAAKDLDSALYDRLKGGIALVNEATSLVTTAATFADAVSRSMTAADTAHYTTVIHRNSIYNLRDRRFRAFLGAVREFFEGGTDGCPSGCATGRIEEHGAEHCMARYLALDPQGDAHELRPYFQATTSMISLCHRDFNSRDLVAMNTRGVRGSIRLDAVRERYPSAVLALAFPGSSALALVRRAYSDIWQDNGRNLDHAVQINFARNFEDSSDGGVRVMKELETYLCSHTRYGANVDFYQSARCLKLCERDPVYAAEFEATTCKYFNKRDEWKNKFPGKAYIWTVDLHSGPVSCEKGIMGEAGAVMHAEIQYSKCHFSDVCGGRLRAFKNDWSSLEMMDGYSLGGEPNSVRRQFFEAYKYDPEFARVDAFLCTHPTANCELFMPFNKSIIIDAAARIEFGRYDDNIHWRKNKITDRSFYRWQQWKRNLQRIAALPHNVVMANNLYDVEYIRHVSGVNAQYMPAWCGDNNATYAPSKESILVGPYRLPQQVQGYLPEPWKHPIMTSLHDARERSHTQLKVSLLGEAYKSYTFRDLVSHPAIVFIPYQVSIMSFFEYYRLGVPLFFPSKALLLEWDEKYDIMDERIYGNIHVINQSPGERGKARRSAAGKNLPDPNIKANLKYWIDLCDFYVFPHVQYFGSWDDLFRQLRTADLKKISADMLRHSEKQRVEILARWSNVLRRVVPSVAEGPRVVPEDFDVAMKSLYGIPPMGPDLPRESTW